MPQIDKHAPGTFSWFELATTDQEGSKAFYQQVLGWQAQDSPMGEGMVYTMYKLGDRWVAGGYALTPDMQQQGVPPNWMPYVCVANADETAAKAKEHGAKMIMEPFDIEGVGRSAVFADPGGAVISIFQPGQHRGTGLTGEHGTACWCELLTKDRASCEAFYKAVFGWNVKSSMPEYTEFLVGDLSHAGMMEILPEWGPVPPNWMTYFQVADCDATTAKVGELGGALVMGPHDIPNVGRFATLRDPAGAHFSVIQLNRP
jgi:uncharacterized protein